MVPRNVEDGGEGSASRWSKIRVDADDSTERFSSDVNGVYNKNRGLIDKLCQSYRKQTFNKLDGSWYTQP